MREAVSVSLKNWFRTQLGRSQTTLSARLLQGFDLARFVPADTFRKIEQPGKALIIYRTPAS